MTKLTLKLEGADELAFALRRFPKQNLEATAIGVYNAMQDVMTEAKARAPYEFGDLEASAYVAKPEVGAKSAMAEGGFGGKAAKYMILQHEREDYQHPGKETKTSNMARAARGEYKFFEKALNNQRKAIRSRIAEAVNYFLKRGALPPLRKKHPLSPR